ncbi:MAG: tyrosine-type recombinase/integrase [Thioalkalivibrio sp.]|nr:tyrosine-type recombinase/integrase [Thioalkalivibrio sp.]
MPYRSTRAKPYLYTEQEVQRLLDAALKLPTTRPSTPLRPWVFHCLLGLLSVTGLRISEALDLQLGDVDLDQDVLTIRAAKLGRSRLVPIHPTTHTVLADYLERRAQFLGQRDSAYVFISNRGTRPARQLPVLSTYLGHVYVSGTYWYLNSWPELMAQAMARLERRWGASS